MEDIRGIPLLLEIGNVYTRVPQATDEEKSWLREYLVFEAKAGFRGGQYRPPEKIRLFSLVSEEFPTGMLRMVRRAAPDEGFQLQEQDTRIVPCVPDPTADLSWLRWYQLEAVEAVVKMRRGLIKLPTAAGKTEPAVALPLRLPCDWLFLVHRGPLLDQAAERFENRTGLVAGRIGEGTWDPKPRFTVATYQTLYKALKGEKAGGPVHQFLAAFGGFVGDECHTMAADSFWQVVMAIGAYYRVGLSATPLERGDRRSVLTIAATGPVIYKQKNSTLQAEGVLSKPTIWMVPVYQESVASTFQGVYGELIVRSTLRNKAIVEVAKKAEKPCLVFVKEISHGRALTKRLGKAGLNAEFIWGAGSTHQRKNVVERLVRGDLDVLVCSVIFQEGVDIPELRSVVIGAGGRSTIATLQRIGRGMRVAEGKDTFEVWDIADRGNRWLERHAKIRAKSYEGEGHTVTETAAVVGS
jgi:superfamily II DNA or RNA helicase